MARTGTWFTIAPTGAGKGRGVIIPNLLRFEGSVIVIDPKGETWHVTHRRRKEMGQEVRLLDPFGAVSKKTDSLNPFDLFDRPGALLDADAEMLASLLAGDVGFHKEPFLGQLGPLADVGRDRRRRRNLDQERASFSARSAKSS